MAIYRDKYILEGLDEIPPAMLADLDIAYDICKKMHDSFPCELCGKCCHQANITLMDSDIERISGTLDMSKDDFITEHLYQRDGIWLFKKSGACKFLGDDKRCTIWQERPEICRDFPYLVSKFMSRVYLALVMGTDADLSYMEDDWPCTPKIKDSVASAIKEARRRRS
ncbi:MAG: YkgJ family cysteine cluster protein [Methanomassiliicoccaceae archaeon]|nr:YkgJ family cysteine cluster protein [Methanomassiliicoccaceae archaeon]